VTDEAGLGATAAKLSTQGFVLFPQPFDPEQPVEFQQEFLRGEGLLEVVVGAQPHGLHCRVHGAEGGHHHDFLLRPIPAKPTQERQPVLAGHTQVRHHHVEVAVLEQGVRLQGVAGDPDLIPGSLQFLGHHLTFDGLVIDNEESPFVRFHLRLPLPWAVGAVGGAHRRSAHQAAAVRSGDLLGQQHQKTRPPPKGTHRG